jgi:hypothetical protein
MQLLRKNSPWRWNDRCQNSFDILKEAFTTAPILRHFDLSLPIILGCDASDYAIAAIISQVRIEGDIRPVAFHARTMINAPPPNNSADARLAGPNSYPVSTSSFITARGDWGRNQTCSRDDLTSIPRRCSKLRRIRSITASRYVLSNLT